VALYQDLPVFRDVYRLTLRIHQLTQSFANGDQDRYSKANPSYVRPVAGFLTNRSL